MTIVLLAKMMLLHKEANAFMVNGCVLSLLWSGCQVHSSAFRGTAFKTKNSLQEVLEIAWSEVEYEALSSVSATVHRLTPEQTAFFVSEMSCMKGALVT